MKIGWRISCRYNILKSNSKFRILTVYTFQNCQLRGSPYPNVIGFIDGTARPICRPKLDQRLQYSGYKKQHVVKYQSVVFPDGIIGRLDGPFNGIRHDAAILGLSGLKEELNELPKIGCENLVVYGDPGYSNQKFIKVGYKNHTKLTEQQKQFNADMSALRVSVEYGFGKIVQQFAYLDFKKNQQLLLQNLRMQYLVAAFLVNCQSCLKGNQTSLYFNCIPPTIEGYVNG
jgi:nuclease HARBI1